MVDDNEEAVGACRGNSSSFDEPECRAPSAGRRSDPNAPDISKPDVYSGSFSRCQSKGMTIESNVETGESVAASSDSPRKLDPQDVLKFSLTHGVPSSSLENSSLTESQNSSQTRSSRSEQGTTDTDQKTRVTHGKSERDRSDDDVNMEDSESDGQVKAENISEVHTATGADKANQSHTSNKDNPPSTFAASNTRRLNSFQRSRQHCTKCEDDDDGPKIRHHVYKTSLSSSKGKKRMRTTASSLTTADDSDIAQVEVEVPAGASGVSTPRSEGKMNDTKFVMNSNPPLANDADPSSENNLNNKGDTVNSKNISNSNNIADDSKSDTSNSSNFFSTSSDEYNMETDRCSSGYDGGKSGSHNGDSGISSDSNSGSGSSGNKNRERTIISSRHRRYHVHTHHSMNSVENSCEGGSSGSDDGYNGYNLRSSGEDGNETDTRGSKKFKLNGSPTTSSSSSSSDRSSSEDNMEEYNMNTVKNKARGGERVATTQQDASDDEKNIPNDGPRKKINQLNSQSERSSSMPVSTSAATTTSETMSNSNSSESLNRGAISNAAGHPNSGVTTASREVGDGSGGSSSGEFRTSDSGSRSGSGSGSGTTGESNDSGGDNENKASKKSSSSSDASTLIKNNASSSKKNIGMISSDKKNVSNSAQTTNRTKMPAPYFYYKDCSQEREEDLMSPLVKPLHSPSFLIKLHALLMRDELKDIISWLPHGRSWKILHEREFEIRVLPIYFNHNKISSFHKQAAEWGFQRLKKGPDQGTFYHERFLRGLPHLCKKMKTASLSRSMVCIETNEELAEPNFFQISSEHPVPIKLDPRDVQNIELKKVNECILEKGHRAKVPASFIRKEESMSLELQNDESKKIVSAHASNHNNGTRGTGFSEPARFRRRDLKDVKQGNSKEETRAETETKPKESDLGDKLESQLSTRFSSSRGNVKNDTLPTDEEMHATLKDMQLTQNQIQRQMLNHQHDQEQRMSQSNHVSGMLYSLQTAILEQQKQQQLQQHQRQIQQQKGQKQSKQIEQKQQALFASAESTQKLQQLDQLSLLQSNLLSLQEQQGQASNQSSLLQGAQAQQNALHLVNASIYNSEVPAVQFQNQGCQSYQQQQQGPTSHANQSAITGITESAKAILAATNAASSNKNQDNTSSGNNAQSFENLMALINHAHRIGSTDPNALSNLTRVLYGSGGTQMMHQQHQYSQHTQLLCQHMHTQQQQQQQQPQPQPQPQPQQLQSNTAQNAAAFSGLTLDTPVNKLSPQTVQNLILQCIAAGAQLASLGQNSNGQNSNGQNSSNEGSERNNAGDSNVGHSNRNDTA